MRATLVVVVLALVGCGRFGFTARGDDAPDAGVADAAIDDASIDDASPDQPFMGDPSGYWTFAEARVLGEGGVRLGNDLDNGIRGNGVIELGQPGSLDLRFLLLADGVQGEIGAGSSELTIDGDRWISSDGTTVAASTVRWNGPDDLTITWNPSDPATVGTPRLEMIRILRATAPPASLVGSKTLERIAYQGIDEFAANTCAPNEGGTSQIVVGTIDISDRLLVTTDFTLQLFSTANCTGAADQLEQLGSGYLEVDGARFRMWLAVDTYDPVAMVGDITRTDVSLRVVRDNCRPAASSACAELPIAAETTP